jgi:predicted RNA binding protein with dsRBD fold (UPF0201 family)
MPFLPRDISNEFLPMLEQYKLFANPNFYMTVLLTTAVATSRDFVWKALTRLMSRDLYHEIQKRGDSLSRDEILERFPALLKRDRSTHKIRPTVKHGLRSIDLKQIVWSRLSKQGNELGEFSFAQQEEGQVGAAATLANNMAHGDYYKLDSERPNPEQ